MLNSRAWVVFGASVCHTKPTGRTVVARATQVGMLDGEAEFDLLAGPLVEAVGQNRLDAAIAVGAQCDRSTRCGLQAVLAVAVGQAQDAQARAERLLGVASGTQHRFDEGRGVRSDGCGPADEAFGGPLTHLSVLLRHMLIGSGMTASQRGAHVAGDALAAVQALHSGGGHTHVELTSDQGVRDRVVVPVHFDVVVDVDPRLLPLGEHVTLGGKGSQRWTVELLEQLTPRARELAERAGVEPLEELRDRGVEFGQREERAVAKRSQDPALDHLHSNLGLRLIPRFFHASREHGHPVMAGQVVVGGIGVGLVAVRATHRRAQIVRDQQLRAAAYELQRAHVRGPARAGRRSCSDSVRSRRRRRARTASRRRSWGRRTSRTARRRAWRRTAPARRPASPRGRTRRSRRRPREAAYRSSCTVPRRGGPRRACGCVRARCAGGSRPCGRRRACPRPSPSRSASARAPGAPRRTARTWCALPGPAPCRSAGTIRRRGAGRSRGGSARARRPWPVPGPVAASRPPGALRRGPGWRGCASHCTPRTGSGRSRAAASRTSGKDPGRHARRCAGDGGPGRRTGASRCTARTGFGAARAGASRI